MSMMSTYEKRIRVYKGNDQFERVLRYEIPNVGDRIRHLNGNLADVKQVCYSAGGEPFVIADFAGHFGVTVAIDQFKVVPTLSVKIKLVCNECGKKRLVSPSGNFNDRCPKCGGVDWDVL